MKSSTFSNFSQISHDLFLYILKIYNQSFFTINSNQYPIFYEQEAHKP